MAQQNVNEIKQNVQEKFAELKSAVLMREKLLLRQLDVINTTRKQQLQSGQQEMDIESGVEFLCDNETELLAAIRNFGRYQLTNMNLALQDVYLKNEDYIKPSDDHETMFKGLNQNRTEQDELAEEDEEHKESVIVDFSRHKSLMEHSAKLMNKSIINITLNEAKELIKQAKLKREQSVPPLNLEELDDEIESSIAEVVSSLEHGSLDNSDIQSNNNYSQTQQQSTKQKKFRPNITINNCNGTINLRNIASLTINCTTEENVKAQVPVRYPNQKDENKSEKASSSTCNPKTKSRTQVESVVSSSSNTECTSPTSTNNSNTPHSSSNYSSNSSSRSQSTKKPKFKKTNYKVEKFQNVDGNAIKSANYSEPQNHTVESSSSSLTNAVTCDFYNRLLDEIKKSINQQQKVRSECQSTNINLQETRENANTSNKFGDGSQEKRFILKNFENLKIVLEAHNSGDEESFHPIQIEQWLAEIITNTDLEPMQNTDILEHSKIYNEETQET